jgi:hypothetical protein
VPCYFMFLSIYPSPSSHNYFFIWLLPMHTSRLTLATMFSGRHYLNHPPNPTIKVLFCMTSSNALLCHF